MTEQEAGIQTGSGQSEIALKQDSGEEKRKTHTLVPLNAKLLQYKQAYFNVQDLVF